MCVELLADLKASLFSWLTLMLTFSRYDLVENGSAACWNAWRLLDAADMEISPTDDGWA